MCMDKRNEYGETFVLFSHTRTLQEDVCEEKNKWKHNL